MVQAEDRIKDPDQLIVRGLVFEGIGSPRGNGEGILGGVEEGHLLLETPLTDEASP